MLVSDLVTVPPLLLIVIADTGLVEGPELAIASVSGAAKRTSRKKNLYSFGKVRVWGAFAPSLGTTNFIVKYSPFIRLLGDV